MVRNNGSARRNWNARDDAAQYALRLANGESLESILAEVRASESARHAPEDRTLA